MTAQGPEVEYESYLASEGYTDEIEKLAKEFGKMGIWSQEAVEGVRSFEVPKEKTWWTPPSASPKTIWNSFKEMLDRLKMTKQEISANPVSQERSHYFLKQQLSRWKQLYGRPTQENIETECGIQPKSSTEEEASASCVETNLREGNLATYYRHGTRDQREELKQYEDAKEQLKAHIVHERSRNSYIHDYHGCETRTKSRTNLFSSQALLNPAKEKKLKTIVKAHHERYWFGRLLLTQYMRRRDVQIKVEEEIAHKRMEESLSSSLKLR